MSGTKLVNKKAIARRKKKLVAARELRIPPDHWIPPEKPPLKETLCQQEFPERNLPDCASIEEKALEPHPKVKGKVALSSKSNSENLPNPFADFSHLVENEPGFQALKNNSALRARNDAALARLKLAFQFIVCRTVRLYFEINEAVKKFDPKKSDTLKAYATARKAYIRFLRNLDDHEPPTTVSKDDLEQGLGYGRNCSYIFIIPIIKRGQTTDGFEGPLITGAIIILQWNPHSSSSGIPIKH